MTASPNLVGNRASLRDATQSPSRLLEINASRLLSHLLPITLRHHSFPLAHLPYQPTSNHKMELIDDRKRLLRLAVVFQLDLEDFILSLRRNQSDEMARSDFIQGVALFLNHAMVSLPATEPLVVKLSTEVTYYAPAATSGSEPSIELVDSLSQSMATTHLPDGKKFPFPSSVLRFHL